MVERRITDGRRLAELLASEVDGREDGPFAHLGVADADRDVEPPPDGARAYDVRLDHGESGSDRLARVYVHRERTSVAFEVGGETAAATADAGGLRTESDPSRGIVVLVPDGAAVKRATDAVAAAAADVLESANRSP